MRDRRAWPALHELLTTSERRHDSKRGTNESTLTRLCPKRSETKRGNLDTRGAAASIPFAPCSSRPPRRSPARLVLLRPSAPSRDSFRFFGLALRVLYVQIHGQPAAARHSALDRVRLGRSWHTGRREPRTSPRRDTPASRNEWKSRCTRRRAAIHPYMCDQLVLRIVLNTRNNLWTGHDDDWNIYSARYAPLRTYLPALPPRAIPSAGPMTRSSATGSPRPRRGGG